MSVCSYVERTFSVFLCRENMSVCSDVERTFSVFLCRETIQCVLM